MPLIRQPSYDLNARPFIFNPLDLTLEAGFADLRA
jgi:hypothetical protein